MPTSHVFEDPIGKIFRICEEPSGYVIGFRRLPPMEHVDTCHELRSGQNVLVVNWNQEEQQYCRVFAEEGLFWVHLFDLVTSEEHVKGSTTDADNQATGREDTGEDDHGD